MHSAADGQGPLRSYLPTLTKLLEGLNAFPLNTNERYTKYGKTPSSKSEGK